MTSINKFLITLSLLLLGLSACAVPQALDVDNQSEIVSQSQQTAASAPSPAETRTAEAVPSICWQAPLPQTLLADIQTEFKECVQGQQNTRLEINPTKPISTWVYALAAPFFTIDDEMSSELLKAAWLQGSQSGVMLTHLLVDQNTYDVFSRLWGTPDPNFVVILPVAQMISRTREQPADWAILPFESITPQWKILLVDGQSPIRKDFAIKTYALSVSISLLPADAMDNTMAEFSPNQFGIPSSNRDADKLTTVLMTGVTALVRGTANTMEQRGMTYPADDIRPWFLDADIVHISNEVPFAENCPQPFPRSPELVFCSQTEYIQLLESISTDVVEISGDHFQDYGADATLYTLDLYDQEGWKYYGGGRDLTEGLKPIKLEDHGNKIAFIGCNAKGGGYAGASETNPGAAECDFEYMTEQIRELRAEGYLPIVTFQHLEYYSYDANPILQEDFHRVADAGAVIVSGSQAHQPHAIEFRDGAFLHYGLGNLFFDQLLVSPDTSQAFIDRHVFYDGRYINTELLTIKFINLARSRPMTLEERQALLNRVFKASMKLQ